MRVRSSAIGALVLLLVAGCVTGNLIRDNARLGMTTAQVEDIIGRPDGMQTVGEFTVYTYANRVMDGWSWDRADYHFVFRGGQVVQYGPGTIRQEGSGIRTVVIIPPVR